MSYLGVLTFITQAWLVNPCLRMIQTRFSVDEERDTKPNTTTTTTKKTPTRPIILYLLTACAATLLVVVFLLDTPQYFHLWKPYWLLPSSSTDNIHTSTMVYLSVIAPLGTLAWSLMGITSRSQIISNNSASSDKKVATTAKNVKTDTTTSDEKDKKIGIGSILSRVDMASNLVGGVLAPIYRTWLYSLAKKSSSSSAPSSSSTAAVNQILAIDVDRWNVISMVHWLFLCLFLWGTYMVLTFRSGKKGMEEEEERKKKIQ